MISAFVIHTFFYIQRPHSFKPHRISLCTRYRTPDLFVISAFFIHAFFYIQTPQMFKPHIISLCTRYWTPDLFVISAFFIHAFFYIQTPQMFKPHIISLCIRYWTPGLFVISAFFIHSFFYNQTPHSFKPHNNFFVHDIELLACLWSLLFSFILYFIFRHHTVLNLVEFLYVLDIELLAFFFVGDLWFFHSYFILQSDTTQF